jgi:uncharacterized protein YbaR (Trm112 family)
LCCPRCRRGLVAPQSAGWICDACSSGYPVIGDIPWLFPDPRQVLAEWRGRLSLLSQYLESESTTMRAEAAATATAATRARLEFVANAHQDQVRRLGALLAPFHFFFFNKVRCMIQIVAK